jgi:predicted phosphodiesterase
MIMPSDLGTKLYSVGLIRDPHIFEPGETTSYHPSDTNALEDLAKAITYFKDKNVDFAVCCGDLTSYGTTASLERYKTIVDANRGDMPVYSIAGNHEYWGSYYAGDNPYPSSIPEVLKSYTGLEALDVIERGNDVFIFKSPSAIENEFTTATVYIDGVAQSINFYNWLEEQFNKYKDKRIFCFMHCFLKGVGVNKAEPSIYCGDATGLIHTVDMVGSNTAKFIQLLQNNPNVIYFHGHSHTMIEMQDYMEGLEPKRHANYDFVNGGHSIHIPSTTMPRDISTGTRVEQDFISEGYIMDVYENYIVLKGIAFTGYKRDENGNEILESGKKVIDTETKIIPIGTYCLPTVNKR